mmetsp:Transcript_236/g.476  ORF Transcript_236/g.476 Transcript_236/m.476 type:complete len:346 (+) Transcript_236:25-1062(+)
MGNSNLNCKWLVIFYFFTTTAIKIGTGLDAPPEAPSARYLDLGISNSNRGLVSNVFFLLHCYIHNFRRRHRRRGGLCCCCCCAERICRSGRRRAGRRGGKRCSRRAAKDGGVGVGVDLDRFDLGHERCPLLLHLLVVLDLELHVVQHHLPHVVRFRALEPPHLPQHARRDLGEQGLGGSLGVCGSVHGLLRWGHFELELLRGQSRGLELGHRCFFSLEVPQAREVRFPHRLPLVHGLPHRPEQREVVRDGLLEPLLLLLHLGRRDEAQLVRRVPHARQGPRQRWGLVLPEYRERQPEVKQPLGELLAALHQRRRVLGHVLHLGLEVRHVGCDLLHLRVLRGLDLF